MNAQGQRKCAYSACQCTVTATETLLQRLLFPTDRVQETEIKCDCKHHPCALD